MTMPRNALQFCAALGALLYGTAASAQGLLTEHRLAAGLANEAVAEAVAACAKNGYTVTAIVVDIDGVRQAVLRGDGAPVHTLDSAYAKAYTAASLAPVRKEDSTKAIFERLSKNPSTTASLGNLPNVTFTPGGVTIMAAGKPIGGIGVGGAPGGNFDDDCARAALDKIKDRMK
ncbi:MAG TPA: heme-binding protein [Xanthobacteraceae bacterium]|nr:heme-binding protein [Xanthobacteraceae bacterium]